MSAHNAILAVLALATIASGRAFVRWHYSEPMRHKWVVRELMRR